METEIHDTFYNLLLSITLDEQTASGQKLDLNDEKTIFHLLKILLKHACTNEFQTINKTKITTHNVPASYKKLFMALHQLKLLITENRDTDSTYQAIISYLIKKNTFKPMFNKLNQFYNECNRDPAVNTDTIRETFYNIMAHQTIENKLIPIEDLEDYQPYIFFTLSSFVIVESVICSFGTCGIKLCNGGVVLIENCPEQYKHFFGCLMMLKDKMKGLNTEQVNMIKLLLQKDKTPGSPEIMQLVAIITDMSINISQLHYFKEIINEVITFCITVLSTK